MAIKKICMLGSFSVGKTSLVGRFVQGVYSEKYLTTVGVKVDKKVVRVGAEETTLMLWDLQGDDDYEKLNLTFLRGSAGFLYVADGTRPASLDAVLNIRDRVKKNMGDLPSVLALNKADLTDQWQIGEAQIEALRAEGWPVRRTSAKEAQGIEETFLDLAARILAA